MSDKWYPGKFVKEAKKKIEKHRKASRESPTAQVKEDDTSPPLGAEGQPEEDAGGSPRVEVEVQQGRGKTGWYDFDQRSSP